MNELNEQNNVKIEEQNKSHLDLSSLTDYMATLLIRDLTVLAAALNTLLDRCSETNLED